jgi:DNA-binding GntR family transcriptional regulator
MNLCRRAVEIQSKYVTTKHDPGNAALDAWYAGDKRAMARAIHRHMNTCRECSP